MAASAVRAAILIPWPGIPPACRDGVSRLRSQSAQAARAHRCQQGRLPAEACRVRRRKAEQHWHCLLLYAPARRVAWRTKCETAMPPHPLPLAEGDGTRRQDLVALATAGVATRQVDRAGQAMPGRDQALRPDYRRHDFVPDHAIPCRITAVVQRYRCHVWQRGCPGW